MKNNRTKTVAVRLTEATYAILKTRIGKGKLSEYLRWLIVTDIESVCHPKDMVKAIETLKQNADGPPVEPKVFPTGPLFTETGEFPVKSPEGYINQVIKIDVPSEPARTRPRRPNMDKIDD